MPKYSFKCNQCNTEFTVNVSWQEKENVQCPNCDSKDKKQDFSRVGVITGSSSDGACGLGNPGGLCPTSGGA